ncbi:peptide deformylase [Paramicrobacterium humi]|uniref:Peptide deformylase n=1 Tax=Paramicrobacterium humi TaxID=640635 RepID=A0A1H4TUA9_9MICO|nr:peptide deformylase [Microbacterium humi]SEC60072.1 peptide deformylase [Microbacterium humi]
MTERPIRLFGDPILKTSCDAVAHIDDHVRALVTDLVDSVQVPGRAGVAANQIGVGLRVFSYNVDDTVGYVINPVLAEVRGEKELVDEGCLSVPEQWHPTPRYPYARVTGIDLDGNPVVVEGTGVLAQALQHETDHLDGLVYLDRLEKEERRTAMKQVRESSWF